MSTTASISIIRFRLRWCEMLLRSSSAMPSACSSSWICRLSGGCVMKSRCAARPKCSSSATATKQRGGCNSIIQMPDRSIGS
ncbi:hypothetical protein WI75_05400 [Burkholderia ubonensis]|nr:hypothetical protein WI75_05400 [Burkholderia ubonensis]